MSFQKNIESLANQFVQQVLAAVRSASLEEIAAGTVSVSRSVAVAVAAASKPAVVSAAKAPKVAKAKGAGRLGRRSPDDIARTLDAIVAMLKDNPRGMRAEDIRKSMGLDSREMPRPLQEGLDSKRLHKKGEKRATTYFAATITGGGKKKG